MHLGARAVFPGGKKSDVKKPGGALVIPKPINLPSRRKENNGFDPNIQLVPGGSTGSWLGPGARPPVPAGAATAVPAYVGQPVAGRPASGPGGPGGPGGGAPAPAGWGGKPATAAPGTAPAVRGAAGGDFPELGGPQHPANPWKTPSAGNADDSKDRYAPGRRPAEDGFRDWAEDDEEEQMDFRRPVVIDRENSGANSVGSSARNGPVGTGSSSSAAQLSESASSAMDARKEARILALKKQRELERMHEQLHEQQLRQEREEADRLLRLEQEEQERRRREGEEQRLAQEEARRRAMEQAEERRRLEHERRLYEERERSWQDEQRRRVEEQRRQQQDRYGGEAGLDDVRYRLSTQQSTMRQASEAAKLRRQQEEERERERELERERLTRLRLEELDRKSGREGVLRVGGLVLDVGQQQAPPRSAWGNAESIGGAAAGGGLGVAAHQEAEYTSMAQSEYSGMARGRGLDRPLDRGLDPKAPRKLYDHKAGKFVSEDQEAWKGINRPPGAEKGPVKSSDKGGAGASSGKDGRGGGGGSGSGQAAAGLAGSVGVGGKESEGLSRAQLKKMALEERRRREKEGKGGGVGEDDEVLGAGEMKASEKPGKRLLTRESQEKGGEKSGKGGAAGRQAAAKTAMVGADEGTSISGVSSNWMAGMAGGLGSEVLDMSLASNAWNSSLAFSPSMDSTLGLHDGDMGGIFKMEDANDVVAMMAADLIGDDEPAGSMQGLGDGGDDSLLDESSFNAPAGWASAASREQWSGETSTSSWSTHVLGQGPSVNIEKAFVAFNGVGNHGMLGGLSYSIPGAPQSNLVWSGTMMPMGNDVVSDWQMNNHIGLGSTQPQGWSAPPPDSFQPAGDEDDGLTAQEGEVGGSSRGEGGSGKGQRGGKNKQVRDAGKGSGGGRGGGKRGRGGGAVGVQVDTGMTEALMSKPAENGAEAQGPAAGAQGGGRGGRGSGGGGSGRAQSANTQSRSSRRNGGDKSGKGQAQADGSFAGGGSPGAAGAAGSAGAGATPKEHSNADGGGGEVQSGGTGGGGGAGGGMKPARGKARGAGKMVAVPANIRLAAQDVIKQRDGAGEPKP